MVEMALASAGLVMVAGALVGLVVWAGMVMKQLDEDLAQFAGFRDMSFDI